MVNSRASIETQCLSPEFRNESENSMNDFYSQSYDSSSLNKFSHNRNRMWPKMEAVGNTVRYSEFHEESQVFSYSNSVDCGFSSVEKVTDRKFNEIRNYVLWSVNKPIMFDIVEHYYKMFLEWWRQMIYLNASLDMEYFVEEFVDGLSMEIRLELKNRYSSLNSVIYTYSMACRIEHEMEIENWRSKFNLPMFDGSNLRCWIINLPKLFGSCEITEEMKWEIIGSSISAAWTSIWFSNYKYTHYNVSWSEFEAALYLRFGELDVDNETGNPFDNGTGNEDSSLNEAEILVDNGVRNDKSTIEEDISIENELGAEMDSVSNLLEDEFCVDTVDEAEKYAVEIPKIDGFVRNDVLINTSKAPLASMGAVKDILSGKNDSMDIAYMVINKVLLQNVSQIEAIHSDFEFPLIWIDDYNTTRNEFCETEQDQWGKCICMKTLEAENVLVYDPGGALRYELSMGFDNLPCIDFDNSSLFEVNELGANGSKILVTTHDGAVVSVMKTMAPFFLKGLSEEDGLPLLLRKYFGEWQKCVGVSLIVMALRGSLQMETDEHFWVMIEDCMTWRPQQVTGGHKRFDKVNVTYDQVRDKFLSLRKSAKTDVALALKEGYELLHQMEPYINQVLAYARLGRCYRTIHYPESQVNRLEITPNKRYLAAAGNPHIRLFDANSNSPQLVMSYDLHTNNVMAVGFQCDGNWMYFGSENDTVKKWNVDGFTLEETLVGHQRWVWDYVFSVDSAYLITVFSDTTPRLWSMSSREDIRVYQGHLKACYIHWCGVELNADKSNFVFDPGGTGKFAGGVIKIAQNSR